MHCAGDEIIIQIDSLTNTKIMVAIGQEQNVTNSSLKYFETTEPSKISISFPNKAFISLKQDQFDNF